MDYKNIHDKIIYNAQIRQIGKTKQKLNSILGYTENHHILPKSLGGTDDESNLVRLTAKEHFIIHLLLWKIYNNSQMFSTIWRLCHSHQGIKITGKTYELLKIQHILETKDRNKTHPNILKKHKKVFAMD